MGGGGVPPIGFPVWCGSHRTHVHQGFYIVPKQVEAKGVLAERCCGHETGAVVSRPPMMTWMIVSARGTAQP